jgi:uncharacterized protein (TIGR04255 family)
VSGEVFQYPTVKEVDFEIRFPHLFIIENKIGEFQESIIKEFPESEIVLERQMMLTTTGPEGRFEKIPEPEPSVTKKSWLFKSEKGYELKIATNVLWIVSRHHKTYNNPDGDRFRDIISLATNSLFQIVKIPIIRRIGLRYIDECPLPSKDNETLTKLYDSTFPSNRFPVNDIQNSYFQITTKRKNHNLTFREAIVKQDEKYKLMLDFDGFETEVPSVDLLKVTDELHSIIDEEYFSIVKEPLKEYMRTGKI